MMILNTSPEMLEEKFVRVFWRTGTSTAGIIDVELPFDSPDAELIAELCAMRYLVFERMVFDRKPMRGKGYRFVVSTGAIRKLVLGKSSKKQLQPYARFLAETMEGCEIIVKKDISRADPADVAIQIDQIYADPKDFMSPVEVTINAPSMGIVHITKHALDRYQQCGNIGGDPIKNPLNSLTKRLLNEEIIQVTMPRLVAEHKVRKYGANNISECWARPGSTLHFQVSNCSGTRTLVTIFRRNAFL